METWRLDELKKYYYQMGYRAPSIEHCPLDRRRDDFVLYSAWVRGYEQHQKDRARVEQLSAASYCKHPLEIQAA
jgi:hypothetical protein